MEYILNEFLKSEKTLYLFSGIIGGISVVIGVFFILYSNHRSFAITMLIIGILEMAVMLPTYLKYQQKIDDKISFYKNNGGDFLETESIAAEKALKSFFWLKVSYGIFIVILSISISYLNPKSILIGVFMALILHLAIAITIDNFGEKYTRKYLTELTSAVSFPKI